jgi:glycosyltransferase involved in cell wall biosynthesis
MTYRPSAINRNRQEDPLVTVGMPVYNAGRYLRAAVLSLINQSFTSWELILIDDASTDDSVNSIRDIKDTRIRIIAGVENRGLAMRLNEAIGLARGKYFARMDQDDLCHPDRFARQTTFLNSHPDIHLVGTKCIAIDESSTIIGCLPFAIEHGAICRWPFFGFYLPHPSWMGKTTWFEQHGYASPGPYFCEDQELLLRTYKSSLFHALPEALLAYRIHSNVRWGKRFRTRVTLLRVQVVAFLKDKEFCAALMAVLMATIRILRDAFWVIIPIGHIGVNKLEGPPEGHKYLAYWASVLNTRSTNTLQSSVTIF